MVRELEVPYNPAWGSVRWGVWNVACKIASILGVRWGTVGWSTGYDPATPPPDATLRWHFPVEATAQQISQIQTLCQQADAHQIPAHTGTQYELDDMWEQAQRLVQGITPPRDVHVWFDGHLYLRIQISGAALTNNQKNTVRNNLSAMFREMS